MVVCCQGASDAVVAVVAVEDVGVLVVIVVEAVEEVDVEPGPLVPVVPAVVAGRVVVELVEEEKGPLVVGASDVDVCPVVDELEGAPVSPVATMDVSGRSVTSAPAAFTAT